MSSLSCNALSKAGVGLVVTLLGLTLAATDVTAQPSMCEGLYELPEDEQADLAYQVRQASRIPEFGLLNGGGYRFADDGRGQYRLELNAGMTFAARSDIYSICEHGHLPAGLGLHAFVGTAGFRSWLFGGYFRYYNQLQVSAFVPVWEIGGSAHLREGEWAPAGRVGVGIGNLHVQLIVLGDVVIPLEDDADLEAIVTLNLRIHLETLAFLL